MPCPTPMHMVAAARRAPRRRNSCSSVVVIRAPEQPSGWPIAMAPPLTFTRSGSSFSSRRHRHRLRRERLVHLDQVEVLEPPARPAEHLAHGRHRPDPHVVAGARPPRRCPHSGPSAAAPAVPVSARSETSSRHAAPSLSGEELPPVTVPPVRNAGRFRGQLVHGQAGPDALVRGAARLHRCSTGTISPPKRPASWARAALLVAAQGELVLALRGSPRSSRPRSRPSPPGSPAGTAPSSAG